MELFDHFKETYHKENERTKALQDSLSIPIGIVSVLTTLLTFYFFNFDFKYSILWTGIFIAFLVFGALFLAFAVRNIYNAYNITSVDTSLAYKLLPVSQEQITYFNELKQYYIGTGQTLQEAETSANDDFKEYLQKLYIEYGSNNNDINATTYGYITSAKGNILISLLIFLITAIPYGINYEFKPSSSTKFEIIKSIPLQLDTTTIKFLKHG